MTTASIQPLNESQHSRVVFISVCEYYPKGQDIKVCFNYTTFEPSVGDKVCLFRVGWNRVDECLATKLFYTLKSWEMFRRVSFRASEIPTSAGLEYYQFCYLTKTGDICGTSKHFQFAEPNQKLLPQLMRVRDKLETFVIQNRADAEEEKKFLELLNIMGQKSSAESSELKICREESAAKTKQLDEMKLTLEEVMKKLFESVSTHKTMAEEWEAKERALMNQINSLKRQLSSTLAVNQEISEEKTALEDRIETIENKVQYYFEIKEITSGTDIPLREYQALMARAEADVKAITDYEPYCRYGDETGISERFQVSDIDQERVIDPGVIYYPERSYEINDMIQFCCPLIDEEDLETLATKSDDDSYELKASHEESATKTQVSQEVDEELGFEIIDLEMVRTEGTGS